MKIAIVYDWVNKFGGAERILLALAEIWPEASLFTAVYNEKKALWANIFQVRPSFLNYFPFLKNKHEILSFVTPYAFEAFNFGEFNVVLTVTSADAKSILTRPSTLHICYCLTPTRYLWSSYKEYIEEPGFGKYDLLAKVFLRLFVPLFRRRDYFIAQRPDIYLSISKTVKRRIKVYYKRDAEIVYPPCDLDTFDIKRTKPKNYFLIVSRFVSYKKIDYVISAFNRLKWKLVIIGSGLDEVRLKKNCS